MKELFADECGKLKRQGLFRELSNLESRSGTRVSIDGKEFLSFCSNDYLGLAESDALKQAAIQTINEYGFGSGSARLICGNFPAYTRLEKRLAAFKGCRASLVFSTGYMANLGLLTTLAGKGDALILDRLCHASLIDGASLSRATLLRYKHSDIADLNRVLELAKSKYRRLWIVTEGVFSMDGDIAPLPEILEAGDRYGARVILDDAHGLGVLGETGAGTPEFYGISPERLILMGTLSKAVGSLGGYVAGSQALIDYLRNKARSFIYTTALPPAVCAASEAGLKLIEENPDLRNRLWSNIERLKQGFNKIEELTVTDSANSAIIPVIAGEAAAALDFSHRLYERGFLVPAIRPPTVPQGKSRLRFTVSAGHCQADIDSLIKAMQTFSPVSSEHSMFRQNLT
ncbi:MAG: 8-amino-7-oxononanoate synthase [bacterium]